MTLRDRTLVVLVATVWGLNFLVIDWGLGDVPPLLFLAVRFVAVVVPAVLLVPRPAVPWRVLVLVGLFLSVGQFGFLYVAMAQGLPPGLAALVLQAQVVLTVVVAAAVLREAPTRRQSVGVLLGVVGLVVVALGRGGDVPLGALLLCLCGALSWAVGNVVVRAARVPGGLGLTVWSGLVVPVPALLLSLVVDGPRGVLDGLGAFGWQAGVATLYTAGVASLVGYGLFTTLLSRNASADVVPWILLAPVVAMTAALVLLGDVPAPGELVGGAVLVVGVLVAVARRPGRAPAQPVGGPAASSSASLGRTPSAEHVASIS